MTGANSGIGYCVAKSLAARNCTVHMLCRNKQRGEEARSRVLSETGNSDVHLHVVDVSDFQQASLGGIMRCLAIWDSSIFERGRARVEPCYISATRPSCKAGEV